jgi:GGDEF domain-containing protein
MSTDPNNQITLFEQPPLELPAQLAEQPQQRLDKKQIREKLDSELAEGRRNGWPVSVISLDINSLKAVNDEVGHEDGDELIDLVGTIIHVVPETLRTKNEKGDRPTDIISVSAIDYSKFEDLHPDTKGSTAGRVGGDEFIIILPNTDEVGAQIVGNRILETFNERFAGPEGDKFRERDIDVGLALGMTTSNANNTSTASSLLRESDEDLYRNKINEVRPLTAKEIEHLHASLENLREARVRPRDLPRYVQWLAAQALLHTELEQKNDTEQDLS